MKIKYLLVLFLFLGVQPIKAEFATDTVHLQPVKLDKKNIRKYKKQKEFDYRLIKEETNIILRAWDWIKRKFTSILQKILDWIFGVKTGGKVLQYFLKALPYLAALLFVYLIFRFLIGIDLIRLKQNNKKNLNKVYLSDEERIIQEEDLNKLIEEAVRNKQYRLAVRYYYLNMLKKLINKGLIQWHNEKTNRDYVREMANDQRAPYFKNLTFIYDYVWYGNYHPAENEFKEIENDFKSFNI